MTAGTQTGCSAGATGKLEARRPHSELYANVLILSELCLYGEGLADALERHPEISVLGHAADMTAGIRCVRKLRPDVVLVDVTMEGGILGVRAIRRAIPDVKLIALAVSETTADIVEYAEVGISGYVTRSASMDDLVQAIHRVVRGEVVCPDPLTATLVRRVEELAGQRSASNGHDTTLTPRELELLQLVERGLSNQEIADQTFIAVPTVKNHLHSIFVKLNVSRRSDAAALLRRNSGGRILQAD